MQKRVFLVSSPCYKANGNDGNYYSLAITDQNGDVLDGVGDHISPNSYGIRNVFEAEGTSFSDEDRLITIQEVDANPEDILSWKDSFIKSKAEVSEYFSLIEEVFRDVYSFIFDKKGKEIPGRKDVYNEWLAANPKPSSIPYYSFLNLIK